MQTRRPKNAFTIPVPTLRSLMKQHSPLARAARVRGNAAGIHGGRKPKYGKRERQQARREEEW